MSEMMTMEQIEATYKDEWVLLADIEEDPGPVIRRARVIWHGNSREEGWDRAESVESRHIGVLFVGDLFPPDAPVPVL